MHTLNNTLKFLALLVAATLIALAPERLSATGACTCARQNDWKDAGCNKTPGGPGRPPGGGGSSTNQCPDCPQKKGPLKPGMPSWWVSEPFINLHVADEPLSYMTSSGLPMTFRWKYKQRYSLPAEDQVPGFYHWGGLSTPRDPTYLVTRMRSFGMTNDVWYSMTNAGWQHNFMANIVFWDWQREFAKHTGQSLVGWKPFQRSYEAMLLGTDGDAMYFNYGATNQSLNPTNCLQDAVSQTQLQPMSGLLYPTNNATITATNGIYWGDPGSGFRLVYPDGSQDIFGLSYYYSTFGVDDNSTAFALLTQRIDPQGRITRLGYERPAFFTNQCRPFNETYSGFYRLKYVVDSDGRTNTFLYKSDSSSVHEWQVKEVDDPFGRKATFTYLDCSSTTPGALASITDAAGISNSFTYADSSGWMSSFTTPYGTTGFTHYQLPDTSVTNGFSQRAIYIAEPTGAHQLYYYTHQSSLPDTATAPTNSASFDDGSTGSNHYGLSYRNTFHWDRRQFATLPSTPVGILEASPTSAHIASLLSSLSTNNLNTAYSKHWLWSSNDNISLSESVSSEREPSPDSGGQIEGIRTWYDYANKPSRDTEGSPQIGCIARRLPDGAAQYIRYVYSQDIYGNDGLIKSNYQSYSKPDGTVGELSTGFTFSGIDLTYIDNSAGQSLSLAYNGLHQPTSMTDSVGRITRFGYDGGSHNLTNVVYENGQTVGLIYYSQFDPATNACFLNRITVQPQGLTNTIAGYSNGLPRMVQTSGVGLPDLWITNTWDGLNRLTGTKYQDGTTISNIYTRLDLTDHKDRLGYWTRYVYDGLQHVTSITNALTNVTKFTYCDCGSLATYVDALTNTTTLTYNNQALLTNIAYPDGSSVTYQYDSAERLTNIVDGSSRSVSLTYNNQGQTTSATGPYGLLWGTYYDAIGRPNKVTNENSVVVTYSFDLVNRLLTRSWPDGGEEGFGYSTNGLIVYTNQDAKVTRLGRDLTGRLTSITNANLEVTRFNYDARSHLTNLVDGLTNNTFWHYDQYGRLTNKVDALGHEIARYTYDPNGRLTNRWLLETTNTVYRYDAVGNLTNIAYPRFTNTYAYDAVSRLTNMVDPVGTTAFSYTATGQLLSEDGPWSSDGVTFSYTQGHRTGLTLAQPSGSWTQSYTYDSQWRLSTLISPAGGFTNKYSSLSPSSSLVGGIALPNGALITNQYDNVGRLSLTALQSQLGLVLDGYGYSYDLLGLRTGITRNLGITTSTVSVGYDAIGQIIKWSAIEADGTARQNEQLGYAYDAGGNLRYRTNNALIQTFTVDPLNELTNITRTGTLTVTGNTPTPATNVTVNGNAAQLYGDFTFALTNNSLADGANSFTIIAQSATGTAVTNSQTINLPVVVTMKFDGNGNLTNDGSRVFLYDTENQLTNVSVAGQWRVDFVFDGINRRRITREYTWASSAWSLTNETRSVYDDMLVLQDRDGSNNPQVSYTRGLDLSGRRQGSGGIGGLLARTDGSGSGFYHSDGNGNISSLANSSANITARYSYDPFGKTIGQWGGVADVNRMRFSSKWHVPQADVYDFGFRFYLVGSQRWANRDPIGIRGGINLYNFVRNDSVLWIDPLGLSGIIGINSTGDGGSSSTSGHSWIDFTPDNGPSAGITTTYGTWGNNPYGLGNGIHPNLERGRTGKARRCKHIDDAAEQKLNETIGDYQNKGDAGWGLFHPCSTFACDAWNTATGENLSPGFPSTPSTLMKNINAADAQNNNDSSAGSSSAGNNRNVPSPRSRSD